MNFQSYDELYAALKNANVAEEKAAAMARAQFGGPAGVAAPSEAEMVDEDEDGHVEEGVKLMRALGFTAVQFSQKKRAKVTPGIPDWKFYHTGRRLTLWWESKAEWGRQSHAQREFQAMAEACGEIYVLGPLEHLKTWLVDAGVATRAGDTFEPTPIAA